MPPIAVCGPPVIVEVDEARQRPEPIAIGPIRPGIGPLVEPRLDAPLGELGDREPDSPRGALAALVRDGTTTA